MWQHARRQIVVLEPGEVEALAQAAREAAQRLPCWHPRRRLLEEASAALTAMVPLRGVAVAPAPLALLRRAAAALLRVG
jgi:hypothetical protein